jgi:hypothetical protein
MVEPIADAELATASSCELRKKAPMRSKGYLIGPAAEHISWYPPIGQPPTDPPARQPGPWPWADAVSGLAEAANVKHIAASLPEGDPRSQLEASAARTTERILDHWCTRKSWPGPGPPPRVIAIAAQLAAMATSHPAGTLRDELQRIAGQALLRPLGRRQA